MKKLTIIIAILFAVNASAQKRCFLIGYNGTDIKTGNAFAGRYDTCSIKYPNEEQMISFFEKRYDLKRVIILAVTEYTNSDRIQFHRRIDPKPSPVPDSVPPIPDSVEFISKRHVAEAYKRLSEQLKALEDKVTVSQYNKIIQGIDAAFGELISVATEDYKKRKKPVK